MLALSALLVDNTAPIPIIMPPSGPKNFSAAITKGASLDENSVTFTTLRLTITDSMYTIDTIIMLRNIAIFIFFSGSLSSSALVAINSKPS